MVIIITWFWKFYRTIKSYYRYKRFTSWPETMQHKIDSTVNIFSNIIKTVLTEYPLKERNQDKWKACISLILLSIIIISQNEFEMTHLDAIKIPLHISIQSKYFYISRYNQNTFTYLDTIKILFHISIQSKYFFISRYNQDTFSPLSNTFCLFCFTIT